MDFDTILEEERLKLHNWIDERATDLFFYVEFWHIYRTTGFLLTREPKHLQLFKELYYGHAI